MTNWISNSKTDKDQDGCKDDVEDLVVQETGVYTKDITECESEESNNNENKDMKIVYICRSFEFVENIDDCPESLILESDNESEITQIIIDPESDESGGQRDFM